MKFMKPGQRMNRGRVGEVLLAALFLCAPATAMAEGGTVSGTVEATPVKFLGDTVVYLKGANPKHPPASHDMDQKGMKFIPRVLAITEGDTVKFLNHDSVDHNVYTPDNEGYNLGMVGTGKSGSYQFKKSGVYSQLCSVHPEMLAYVFVGENPYSAVPDKAGHYSIKNVPPGTYQVSVWNAHLKAAEQPVTVAAGKAAEVNVSLKR